MGSCGGLGAPMAHYRQEFDCSTSCVYTPTKAIQGWDHACGQPPPTRPPKNV